MYRTFTTPSKPGAAEHVAHLDGAENREQFLDRVGVHGFVPRGGLFRGDLSRRELHGFAAAAGAGLVRIVEDELG